jgi:ActR/RegA family two-component response regulator
VNSGISNSRIALIVHSDVAYLSKYQSVLAASGFLPVVARDLATALLAMTQHQFSMGIIASDVSERGDGWSLAGVFRMAFPGSRVGVLTSENDMFNYVKAINVGVQELFLQSVPPDGVVRELAREPDADGVTEG